MENLERSIIQSFRKTPLLDDTVWFLGCSCVYGEAVNDRDSSPSQLSRLLDYPVDNLGIRGASPELIILTYKTLVKKYTPKFVIVSWPHSGRMLHIGRMNKIINFGPWAFDQPGHEMHSYPEGKQLYQQRLLSGEIEKINKKLIEDFEFAMSDPYVSFRYNDTVRDLNGGQPSDLAHDSMHPGPQSHTLIAKFLYDKIKSRLV